jgi:tetratricopeptide (TPR) repeat protein
MRAPRPDGRELAPWLLALLVCAVYVPSLRHGFVYDDREVILEQTAPAGIGDVARYFAEPHGLPSSKLPYYRPVVRATLLAQKAWHGDDPAWLRAGNVALAAAAALLAYAILRQPAFAVAPAAAFLAAALFVLHPVASACVEPIASGRETLLPGVLSLAALAAFLRPGRRAYAGALAAFALALFGKENSLVAWVPLVLADALRVSAEPPGASARRWIVRHLPFLALAALYLGVRAAVLDLPPAAHLGSALAADPLGPLRALAYALQVTVAPFAELRYEPPFESWFSPGRTALAGLAALGVVAGAARPWPAARSRLLFWLGWFGVWWLPTANLLPQEVRYAERFVFVAWLALCALVAATLSGLRPGGFGRRAGFAVACALVAAAAGTTARIGDTYRDDVTFYREWVRTSPGSANARFSLGTALARQDRDVEALGALREALRLDPGHAAAHVNLGTLLARQGRFGEAEQAFRDALRADPVDAGAHLALALLLERTGRAAEARAHHAEARRLAPGLAEAERGPPRLPPDG